MTDEHPGATPGSAPRGVHAIDPEGERYPLDVVEDHVDDDGDTIYRVVNLPERFNPREWRISADVVPEGTGLTAKLAPEIGAALIGEPMMQAIHAQVDAESMAGFYYLQGRCRTINSHIVVVTFCAGQVASTLTVDFAYCAIGTSIAIVLHVAGLFLTRERQLGWLVRKLSRDPSS